MAKYTPIANKNQEIELTVQELSRRIESLKVQFNLFFSGELDIPPEKERTEIEKFIRNLQYSSLKSPRINLLLQNVTSKFTLFNNMWLKKLNEIETGIVTIKRKKTSQKAETSRDPQKDKIFGLSLNREDSFETVYEKFCELKSDRQTPDKDRFINSLKTKLISSNLVDAKAAISIEQGKLKIKIKK